MEFMQSLLILGNKTETEARIEKYISDLHISQFDILKIGRDETAGIDDVKKIRAFVTTSAVSGKIRAAVIYDAEKATTQAQNALLKVLEEPPANCLIILTASKAHSLMPTVVSRCQIVFVSTADDTPDDDHEKTIRSLSTRSVAEKILIVQEKIKTKADAMDFLSESIRAYHSFLHENPQASAYTLDRKKILTNTRKCLNALTLIENNCNPRLTLEVLLIGLN